MIELRNIVIRYGNFTAVHDLNLTINEGEFFTLLGPSGCGKVMAFGKDISGLLPEERDTGFVFQNYALFPGMNVYENVAYGLRAHNVPKKDINRRDRAIAEKTGISEHLEKRINNLSGGQRQRIAIARALVMEPNVLLIDEPLSNLDAKLRVSTREEIRKLQRSFGITTIYVTHDQEEAMAISDLIAVFNVGYLEQVDTPKEVYNQPATGVVARFIGDINALSGEVERRCRARMVETEHTQLYVRPHKMRVSGTEPASSDTIMSIPAKVGSYEYLGAFTKIIVTTADGCNLTSLMFGAETEYEVSEDAFASCGINGVYALKED